MPRIFDNINERLLPIWQQTLTTAVRADFSVGCFNLHGWKQIAAACDDWPGVTSHCCHLLVEMQHTTHATNCVPRCDSRRNWPKSSARI